MLMSYLYGFTLIHTHPATGGAMSTLQMKTIYITLSTITDTGGDWATTYLCLSPSSIHYIAYYLCYKNKHLSMLGEATRKMDL